MPPAGFPQDQLALMFCQENSVAFESKNLVCESQVCLFPRAALTKYHKQRILSVLESGSPKSKW